MALTAQQSPKRGATPSPRSVLAAAAPHLAIAGSPPNFITKPPQISFWGNYSHGDCVTAEEAFAKACNNPEIFIADDEVITWATNHGVLEGATLPQVLQLMQNDGFSQNGETYDDGPYFSVNWTNSATLQSAISTGPVKIAIAADQVLTAWQKAGSSSAGGKTWFGTGFTHDAGYDHCVSLCGYGTFAWLAAQLGVAVPAGLNGATPGYAVFTWDSIGIIDEPSLNAITCEAWLRQPTTLVKGTGLAGTWSGMVEWEPSGTYVSAGPWTFKTDGTWSYAFGGGRWIQVDATAIWTFSNAAGLVYTGTVSAGGLKGVMGYTTAGSNPGKGRFTGTRIAAEAAEAALPEDPLIAPPRRSSASDTAV
jgi:hypothetical protein